MHGLISVLRNGVLGAVCLLLTACSAPVSIVKPLDVSRAEQSASAEFVVRKTGDYRFALLFTKKDSLPEILKQIEVWGNYGVDGVAIPIHLRVLKDGQVFFEKSLITVGVQWGQTFDYEGRRLNTAVRLIKTLELSPGSYSVEVSTLGDLEAFRGIEGFVEFSYYDPKH
ncbi:DUF5625 family protein [Pseudomonas chlororaphis]|uniref:DUF5625 family protein n=1 Tax=Pseudomonas chlororaphis TaxID=587753 RepID=UPI002365AEBA|nr:DUF5625 family protein [Pseudomonas chlororaphis]WDG52355.1 DUF5625 family protein [Pseudomonas chlororaphis]WDH86628.1 DUF5625 family protein [Pseudomonas chlororaphis]